jgi:hypothetical protein
MAKTKKLFPVLAVATALIAAAAMIGNLPDVAWMAAAQKYAGALNAAADAEVLATSVMFAGLCVILLSYNVIARLMGASAPWDPHAAIVD